VIGIPNCIYFLNKFHTAYNQTGNKKIALVMMVDRMGIVTLFCNLTAAIGFAVFALTQSQILKEFGFVAGINIIALFFISLILIPAVLSFLPAPKSRHTRYLDNRWLRRSLEKLERWSLNHRKLIYIVTGVIIVISIAGASRLRTLGYILDDIPKTDKIYTDLRFFETHFKGVMPLEIVIDTRKKMGASRNLTNLLKMDSLTSYLVSQSYIGKPLTITEGLKFAKQAFFEGDSNYYIMPGDNDLIALRPYLSGGTTAQGKNSMSKMLTSFMDSNRQKVRISVSMKDIGSARLPNVLDSIENQTYQYFDSSHYGLQLERTSVTFLEGS